jgi:hypothetical protein
MLELREAFLKIYLLMVLTFGTAMSFLGWMIMEFPRWRSREFSTPVRLKISLNQKASSYFSEALTTPGFDP